MADNPYARGAVKGVVEDVPQTIGAIPGMLAKLWKNIQDPQTKEAMLKWSGTGAGPLAALVSMVSPEMANHPVDTSKALVRWFSALDPAQRQDVLDMVGQGTLGAGAGAVGAGVGSGVLSVPMAAGFGAAGSVAGDVIAKNVGPLLGAEGYDPNQTEDQRKEELGRIASGGAAMDLLGGGLGIAGKGLARGTQSMFRPAQKSVELMELANELGIGDQMSLLTRMGEESKLMAILSYLPSSQGGMRRAAAGDLRAIEDAVKKLGLDLRDGPVTPEQFANISENQIQTLRNDLQDILNKRIPENIQNATPEQGGMAYREAKSAANEANRQLGNETFGKLFAEHGDLQIPVDDLGQAMREAIGGDATRDVITGALSDRSKSTMAKLSRIGKANVTNKTEVAVGGARPKIDRPTVSLSDLHELRSELIKEYQGIHGKDQGFNSQRLSKTLGVIRGVEDSAIKAGVIPEDVAARLTDARNIWESEAMRLRVPRGVDVDSPGNEMADLHRTTPNQIINQSVQPKSPQRLGQSLSAATPMDPVTREIRGHPGLDTYKAAATRDKLLPQVESAPGEYRWSPAETRRRIAEMGDEVIKRLDADKVVRGASADDVFGMEADAYNSRISKLAMDGNMTPENVLRRATGTHDNYVQTARVIDGADYPGFTARATFDDLVERSTGRDPKISGTDMEVLNPRKLQDNIDAQRNVIREMFSHNKERARQLDMLAKLGIGTKATEVAFGNPSGTALVGAALKVGDELTDIGKLMTSPLGYLARASQIGLLPKLGAYAASSPTISKKLTGPLVKMTPKPVSLKTRIGMGVPMAVERNGGIPQPEFPIFGPEDNDDDEWPIFSPQ